MGIINPILGIVWMSRSAELRDQLKKLRESELISPL
jgi:hypothetical protein